MYEIVKVRLFVEIEISGEWYCLKPYESINLGIPCPKYPSSIFDRDRWDFTIESNHFFVAILTGNKNPHNIITLCDRKHILTEKGIPLDSTPIVKELLELAVNTEDKVYGITSFKGELFLDSEYWDQELYNGSMKLRYCDLISDFGKWVSMVKEMSATFDNFRFIIWVEET
jgi:hypothetical protein